MTILYVNGDSHTAAAEATNAHAFAEDDPRYFYLGRAPHPENAVVSWGTVLGRVIKATTHNDSESASSNDRIIRTTREWLDTHRRWSKEIVMIIQWSTWERQEWLIDGVWYQINASGIDQVPKSHQDQYREFVSAVDWAKCARDWHNKIWAFHIELQDQDIQHVFFNGNNDFSLIPRSERLIWDHHFISPYDPEMTYNSWLRRNGHSTVYPESWHFGTEAHATWARFMLQYGIKHQIWG